MCALVFYSSTVHSALLKAVITFTVPRSISVIKSAVVVIFVPIRLMIPINGLSFG